MKALKILFFVGAFFAVIFTVMANMGGTNDTLKGAIEDFLSEATGYQARVTTLNNMSFFPSIAVDIEDVNFFSTMDNNVPVATLQRADIAMGFWTVMFKTPNIKRFFISELNIIPGVITRQAISLERAGIFETAKGRRAYFVIKGTLGEKEISVRAEMEKSGSARKPQYKFGDHKFVEASIGELTAEGSFNNEGGRMNLSDIKIQSNDDILTGDLSFMYEGAGRVGVSGELNAAGTKLRPDFRLHHDDDEIKGEIIITELQLVDVENETGFPFILQKFIDAAIGDDEQNPFIRMSNMDYKLDIDLVIEALKSGEQNIGSAKLPLSLDDGHLVVGPASGTVNGQEISGTGCVEAKLFGLENIIYALVEASIAKGVNLEEMYPCAQFKDVSAEPSFGTSPL